MFDWFREVNWLISLVVGLILSVVGNLLTPYVANWLATTSRVRARKRIKVLETDLALASLFAEAPQRLTIYALDSILRLVIVVSVASAISALSTLTTLMPIAIPLPEIGAVLSSILYMYGVGAATVSARLLDHARDFARYKRETEQLLERLKQRGQER